MKLELLEKWIAPLKRRVMQSVARALIKTIADDRGLQKLQVELLADEVHSNVDRVQEYGFTSHPLPGAEGVFVSVGGAREHGVIIAIDDRRYRLKPLVAGEVALYTDEGDKIHFKRGKKIEITAGAEVVVMAPLAKVICTNAEVTASDKIKMTATTKVEVTTPIMTVTGLLECSGIGTGGQTATAGNVLVGGNVAATGDVSDVNGSMQEMRGTYNGHTHSDPQGGSTGTPTPQMT